MSINGNNNESVELKKELIRYKTLYQIFEKENEALKYNYRVLFDAKKIEQEKLDSILNSRTYKIASKFMKIFRIIRKK